MKILVVGAGIFGVSAAVELHDRGHEVCLIDRASGPCTQATAKNQNRVHRGYHYPRSGDTIRSCKEALTSFTEVWGDAIIDIRRSPAKWRVQLYTIASEGSLTTADQYEAVLNTWDLPYRKMTRGVMPNVINWDTTEAAFQVLETFVDPSKIYLRAKELLRQRPNIRVEFNAKFPEDCIERALPGFDAIVLAVYDKTAATLLKAFGIGLLDYRVENVIKPVFTLPDRYKDCGAVVMDGPFGALDPVISSRWPPAKEMGVTHIMGHVDLAIVDKMPTWHDDPRVGETLIDETAYKMQRDLSRWLPFVKEGRFQGAFYVRRLVKKHTDATDERLSFIRSWEPDDERKHQTYALMSAKLTQCVDVARELGTRLS